MIKQIVITLFVLLLSFSAAVSQAKVGTTGAQFLELSPSVKANGMGQAGMTVVSNSSYYHNPAILGLLAAQKKLSLAFRPTPSKLSSNTDFLNLSLPITLKKSTNSELYIGVAYYRTKLIIGPFVETTYEYPNGTGRTFSWEDKAENIVLSLARTGTVDFAFGITAKYINQSTSEYSTDGLAFDIGGIVRQPIRNSLNKREFSYFAPTIGFSIRNFGPDMTFISNSFPLPTSVTVGFSSKIGKKKQFTQGKTADLYSLTPAFDVEKQKDSKWVYRFGLDVSFYEILNVRIGQITDNGSDPSETTYGFSISTFRIGKFKMLTSGSDNSNVGGLFGILYNRLNIEYNFANYDNNFYDTQNFHELVLSVAL